TDPEEILPAIRRAAANGKPSIVNVEIDNESLSPFIAPYAEMFKGGLPTVIGWRRRCDHIVAVRTWNGGRMTGGGRLGDG
ncbi:MAG: hypothetical protein JRH17_23815, partial [Deltaproteobacteria bacterium]|nr:hypothetical protein [Deltaproteobacteria bacterium]